MALSRSMALFLLLLAADIWMIDAGDLAIDLAKKVGKSVVKEAVEEGEEEIAKDAANEVKSLIKEKKDEHEEKMEIQKVEDKEVVVENDMKMVEKAEEKGAMGAMEKDEEMDAGEDDISCLLPSTQFEGLCLSSEACAGVCIKENLLGGKCKFEGATRKCFCKKPC